MTHPTVTPEDLRTLDRALRDGIDTPVLVVHADGTLGVVPAVRLTDGTFPGAIPFLTGQALADWFHDEAGEFSDEAATFGAEQLNTHRWEERLEDAARELGWPLPDEP